MFGLILPVAMIPVWFLGGQYIFFFIFYNIIQKSCRRDTPNLLTDADSSTNIFVLSSSNRQNAKTTKKC